MPNKTDTRVALERSLRLATGAADVDKLAEVFERVGRPPAAGEPPGVSAAIQRATDGMSEGDARTALQLALRSMLVSQPGATEIVRFRPSGSGGEFELDATPLDLAWDFNPTWEGDPATQAIKDMIKDGRARCGEAVGQVFRDGATHGSCVLVGADEILTIGHVLPDGTQVGSALAGYKVRFSKVTAATPTGWQVELREATLTKVLDARPVFARAGGHVIKRDDVFRVKLELEGGGALGVTPVAIATASVASTSCYCVHFSAWDERPGFKVDAEGGWTLTHQKRARPYIYKTLAWGTMAVSGALTHGQDEMGVLLHGCNVREGASGAPVFDSTGRLRGIHFAPDPRDRPDVERPNLAADIVTLPL